MLMGERSCDALRLRGTSNLGGTQRRLVRGSAVVRSSTGVRARRRQRVQAEVEFMVWKMKKHNSTQVATKKNGSSCQANLGNAATMPI